MREAEFKAWLVESGFTDGTISTQMSKVRKLAKHFGDLDELNRRGGFPGVIEQLKSPDGSPAVLALGNDRERRQHLPTTLRYYQKFIAAEQPGGNPVDREASLHDAFQDAVGVGRSVSQ